MDLQTQNAQLNVNEKEREIHSANQNSSMARIVNIVYYLFGVLELLIGLRIVLHAIGVNADNSFASFIYGLPQPFVALFSSLFANSVLSPTAVLELTSIIAMVVYAISAWLIGRFIWLALSRPR